MHEDLITSVLCCSGAWGVGRRAALLSSAEGWIWTYQDLSWGALVLLCVMRRNDTVTACMSSISSEVSKTVMFVSQLRRSERNDALGLWASVHESYLSSWHLLAMEAHGLHKRLVPWCCLVSSSSCEIRVMCLQAMHARHRSMLQILPELKILQGYLQSKSCMKMFIQCMYVLLCMGLIF